MFLGAGGHVLLTFEAWSTIDVHAASSFPGIEMGVIFPVEELAGAHFANLPGFRYRTTHILPKIEGSRNHMFGFTSKSIEDLLKDMG
jgi:hypothetical protein